MKKAIGWKTYEKFILTTIGAAGGAIDERELDEVIRKHFMPMFTAVDLETDRRGVPRWRQYTAFAKSRLTREGITRVTEVDGRQIRTTQPPDPSVRYRKPCPGSRFAMYRRRQPPTRELRRFA